MTLTNLAGSCWRTGDDERAQCVERGPCGASLLSPIPAPTLPLPSETTTDALRDLCLMISVTMVKPGDVLNSGTKDTKCSSAPSTCFFIFLSSASSR